VSPRGIWFGAAYYPEYQPVQRLGTDLDLMRDAGFSVIRVGESVWSTWEPRDGELDLDWLAPVVDGAHARGIGVVLGTPTYAVPPWLQRKLPEIAAETGSGKRVPWGARQELDITHPGYRFHAERIIRAVIGRYAPHPAVVGFQLDNEPGLHLLHNRPVFDRFVGWLRRRYRGVDELNAAWGLAHWSHRLSEWDELWPPDGNLVPQYDLAWRTFQAELVGDFIAWQARIAREYARPDQFVTTCIDYARPAVEDVSLAAGLDVASANVYYATQDGLAATTPGGLAWPPSGSWALYFCADRAYATGQAPFLVTETNATSVGPAWLNRPGYDGQWRQAAWALISRGGRSVQYWHWHTLHYGWETYWGGILPHSLRPGRVYEQVAELGREIAGVGGSLAGLIPDADVGFVWSTASKWAFEFAPPLSDPAGGPDRDSYQRIVGAFYQGWFEAGAQARLLHPDQLHTGLDLPTVVVAGLYAAEDATLDLLAEYAHAGGHLVLGPRTGYADHEGRARWEPAPARLVEAAGVSYTEYSNLTEDLPVRAAGGSPLAVPAGAAATAWVDGLIPAGAEPLAWYEHRHFGRWPAITTTRYGHGRVTYVGTVPDRPLAAALARWAGVTPWAGLAAPLRATSARLPDGRRVRFVHNWSWDSRTVRLSAPVTDLPTGERLTALAVPAWGVRLLLEEGP
jgi:beta-galactosidase